MLAVENKSNAAGSSTSRPLPLENGDFMHTREFLRRYERMPQVKKAELIEGVVYCMGDLRDKRQAYCRNGVREYLVWLVAEVRLEWFCLEDDDYRPQLPDAQGELHRRVFPGLRLPVAPLLAGHQPGRRRGLEAAVVSDAG